jgi:two-component sensor histidine kinase/DNA-binding response OmpR family regulator
MNKLNDKKITALSVAVIEDDSDLNTLILRMLNGKEIMVSGFRSAGEILECKENFDLYLIDYTLPDMTADDLIVRIKARIGNFSFIIMTGFGDERLAVAMMKMGAKDYIIKDSLFLELVGDAVDHVLEEMRKDRELAYSRKELGWWERVFENVQWGIAVMDADGKIILCNKIYDLYSETISTSFNLPEVLFQASRTPGVMLQCESHVPGVSSTNLLVNFSGIEDGLFLANVQNITQLKQVQTRLESSLMEKDILLKEVHHRVKNNLQIVSSMFALQSYFPSTQTMNSTGFIEEFRNRIQSMALIHERLYRSDNFSQVNLRQYAQELVSYLVKAYSSDMDRIHIVQSLTDVTVSLDQAVPCGLLLNEILTNAIKYAYPAPGTGVIRIFLEADRDFLILGVEDHGQGLKDDFSLTNQKSLGMVIIQSLASQLGGHLEFQIRNPTVFSVRFPAENNPGLDKKN